MDIILRNTIRNINAGYCFFVSSIYMGVMWSLHYFWYEGWSALKLDNVAEHFVGPTSRATEFFTILVPIMFAVTIIMIIMEWKKRTLWPTLVIFLGIALSTYVGYFLIIPINKEIAAGLATQEDLNAHLEKWMYLNNVRKDTTTVMWLGCLFYYILKKD